MFTFFFFCLGFVGGYMFRGSRLARWLHSWFEQTTDASPPKK